MVRVKGLNLRSPTDAKVSGRQQCAYQDLERWNLQQCQRHAIFYWSLT